MFESIQRYTLGIPYTKNGHGDIAPAHVYFTSGEFTGDEPLVILGFGEEGFVAKGLARWLQKQGQQAAIGVPLYPNADCIEHVAKDSPGAFAGLLNQKKGNKLDATVNTITHSLGAATLLYAAPDTVQLGGGRHALIAPGSVNNEAWGDTPDDRMATFWNRLLIQNMRAPGLLTSRLFDWRIGMDLSRRVVSDAWIRRVLQPKFDFGLSDPTQDKVRDGLAFLAEHSAAAVLTGVHDKVVPDGELTVPLEIADPEGNITRISVDGAHEGMSSRLGKRQVSEALRWIKFPEPTAA